MTSQRVCYECEGVIEYCKEKFPELNWDRLINGDEGERLPPFIWRSRWDELAPRYGLPYSRKYLQNLDSMGIGIKQKCEELRRKRDNRKTRASDKE